MKRILTSVYEQFQNMTTELEHFEDIRFKNLIVAQACGHKMKHCTKQARMLFKNWMESENPDNNDM